MRRAGLAFVTAALVVGCGGGSSGVACSPTLAPTRPLPPDVAKLGLQWFGQGDLYVVVPLQPVRDGDRWHMKVPWFRMVAGSVTVAARRLDGAGGARIEIPPAGAYPSTGPLPTSVDVDRAGCWEITGTLGATRTTIVVRVGPAARP